MPNIPPRPQRPSTVNLTEAVRVDNTGYVVDAGRTIYSTVSGAAFTAFNGSTSNFTNNGLIWSRDTVAPGALSAIYFGGVVNNGIIVSEGIGNGQAFALSPGTSGEIINTGSIYSSAENGAVFGIHDYGHSLLTNSGLIYTQGGGVSHAIVRENGGPIHNLPTGSILSEGSWAGAITVNGGSFGVAAYTVDIFNEGLIEASSLFISDRTYGLFVQNSFAQRMNIVNSGTIRGFWSIVSSEGIYQNYFGRQSVTNLSTGILDGLVSLGPGDDSVINEGLITGLISLEAGNDEYFGQFAKGPVIVSGGSGEDRITTGSFADLVLGGAGNDEFRGRAADFNGDNIGDLDNGDKIIITDAQVGNFVFSLIDHKLTFSGATVFLSGFSGSLRVSAAAGGGVVLTATGNVRGVKDDFNGDGRSDLIWRHSGGDFAQWLGQSNGTFVHSGLAANPVGPDWKVVATGDFNGDGRDDIVWRHSGGALAQWFGQANGTFTNNGAAAAFVGNDWSIVGSGDFNGDGRADLIWRHSSGEFVQWLGQQNGSYQHSGRAANSVDLSWSVVGTGDFNGDGREDVLWRQDGGDFVAWFGQSNGTFNNGGVVLTHIDSSWAVVGTGDFNGDGHEDLLMLGLRGELGEWQALPNGTFMRFDAATIEIDVGWRIAAIGDYNGDGHDDISWRHRDGVTSAWLSNPEGVFIHDSAVPELIPPTWQIQAPEVFIRW